jgi:pimeloyl-ACP methyl ester carboxylesterase
MLLGVGKLIEGADAAALVGLEITGVVHRRIDVGEVTLHVALAGEGSGPLVVLLHGFPELWWSWRYQIPALLAAGFRVAAPDLRGYNLSDQPPLVSDYGIGHLVADIDGLIRALGEEKAHVVAHDWGAMVAWELTMTRPERVSRLALVHLPLSGSAPAGAHDPAERLRLDTSKPLCRSPRASDTGGARAVHRLGEALGLSPWRRQLLPSCPP